MCKKYFIKIIIAASLFAFLSCSAPVPLFEYPPDWKEVATREKTIADYSKYLIGRKIFLDPGHGGEDRKNTSLSGDIVEADVNLRVASYLREYLTATGANVIMSRENDNTVQLAFRSELANISGADIYISIHHNAPAKSEDAHTNYTSTYYHAKETDYEFEPCEHDLARYIQRDLSYVMGNPGGLGSFDGTYSDYLIYPGEGFSVLRKTTIPSVLVECAFHTSRYEEFRLNDEIFNQIQAWGIFRGLAKYFKAGITELKFLQDSLRYEGDNLQLAFFLKDSTGINPKTIEVFFDQKEIQFTFDAITNILNVSLKAVKPGAYPIRVICENKNGNHSLPYHKKIEISDSHEIKFID